MHKLEARASGVEVLPAGSVPAPASPASADKEGRLAIAKRAASAALNENHEAAKAAITNRSFKCLEARLITSECLLAQPFSFADKLATTATTAFNKTFGVGINESVRLFGFRVAYLPAFLANLAVRVATFFAVIAAEIAAPFVALGLAVAALGIAITYLTLYAIVRLVGHFVGYDCYQHGKQIARLTQALVAQAQGVQIRPEALQEELIQPKRVYNYIIDKLGLGARFRPFEAENAFLQPGHAPDAYVDVAGSESQRSTLVLAPSTEAAPGVAPSDSGDRESKRS